MSHIFLDSKASYRPWLGSAVVGAKMMQPRGLPPTLGDEDDRKNQTKRDGKKEKIVVRFSKNNPAIASWKMGKRKAPKG